MTQSELHRADWKNIEAFVTPGTKVLDLGCGDGGLLDLLRKNKNIQGRGVEIDQKNILACIEKGISVFQSDLDGGLTDYGDKSFDLVILSLTLQEVRHPERLLKEMLRVGRKAIVSIPNFGHWEMRSTLFFFGECPKSTHLPYDWYNTPNIRYITIFDFETWCKKMNIRIEAKAHTCAGGRGMAVLTHLLPNLFSEVSVFLIS